MRYLSLILLIILSSCTKKIDGNAPSALIVPEKLSVGSVSNLGIFDPSLTFDTTTNTLWMSYSGVDTSAQVDPSQRVVSTRLASSSNGGITWIDQSITLAGVNNVAVTYPGLPSQGAWQNEVSKIIYDPYSVGASDRWKLLTHHYLQVKSTDPNADRRFEHGWISYKKAATPQLLASAIEYKLFGAASYNSASNTAGGMTGSPLAGAPLINMQSLHSDLNNCLIFTEPGLLSTPTNLYLSLICVEAANYRVALFSCAQPCAMTSGWSYIKTILQNTDANSLGNLNFSATDLFTYQNDNYLMVSPEGVMGSPGIYHGCNIYKFANIATGVLTSSLPIKTVSGTINSFNGACSFNENATNGFYYSEVNSAIIDTFQIFKSNQKF
jgi:hypothetical protein